MMTSRSEYRLSLRQDNADERLTPLGRRVGLVSDKRYYAFLRKYKRIKAEEERLKKTVIPPTSELNALLTERGTAPTVSGVALSELIKRPELSYKLLKPFDINRPSLSEAEANEVEIRLKYEGYILRQSAQINKLRRARALKLPNDIDYDDVYGLRTEAREKLKKIKPIDIAQAGSIPGVNPADISVLMIYLARKRGSK